MQNRNIRTTTVSHGIQVLLLEFPQCSGHPKQGLLVVHTNVLYWDSGMDVQELSGIVGIESELGHSLTLRR